MWICIAINNTGVDFAIDDLAVRFIPGEARELSKLFTRDAILSSRDLFNGVDSQSIIINDGSKNLKKKQALKYISY